MTSPATIPNPAPAPLAVATITTDSGTVTIPCEPINDQLAITPVFGMDAAGKTLYTGAFVITHRTTGTALTDGGGCIVCARNVGNSIAGLNADWSQLGPDKNANAAWFAGLPEQTRLEFQKVRALEWLCDADYCDEASEGDAA